MRAAPVLAAAVTVTLLDPVPLVGLIVAQVAVLVADHPQVVPLVETVTVLDPPAAAAENEDADSAYVHDRAACVTVNVWPAMVSVAVRADPVLAAAVIVTVPDPLPLAGLTVAQVELLEAVQPQPEALAVTPTLLLPPPTAAPHDEDANA